eukprot:g20790.t1
MEWGTLRHLYINLSIMSLVHCDKLEKLAQAQVAERLWQGFCEQGVQSVMIQTRKRLARAKGSKKKAKPKRKPKKKKAKGDEESERSNMILASQPSPERELNLSRVSTMEYEPILDERGKVINLYDFLEEAKTKSYRVMCEAADEHGLERAINARVAREMDEYIEQYSAAWSEELGEVVMKLPVVRWLVRDKMRTSAAPSRRYGYEIPHGGAPVRSKSINFSQYIHTLESAQSVGNWPVNVLSQKLASGEYLEGPAYDDCIDNCSTIAPFMEEVPLEGDIVAGLCQYYQRRIAQCVVIGKPPPQEVLGEMFSDVVWDDGASAELAHSKRGGRRSKRY